MHTTRTMEGNRKSKKKIALYAGVTAVLLVMIFFLVRSRTKGPYERSLSSMPTAEEKIVVEGVDPNLDVALVETVAQSVPGVLSARYEPRSQVLSLKTTPGVFRREGLARSLVHVGLGWYLEDDDGDRPYRILRARLLQDWEKRRAFFERSRDEIVFKKKEGPGQIRQNELELPTIGTKKTPKSP